MLRPRHRRHAVVFFFSVLAGFRVRLCARPMNQNDTPTIVDRNQSQSNQNPRAHPAPATDPPPHPVHRRRPFPPPRTPRHPRTPSRSAWSPPPEPAAATTPANEQTIAPREGHFASQCTLTATDAVAATRPGAIDAALAGGHPTASAMPCRPRQNALQPSEHGGPVSCVGAGGSPGNRPEGNCGTGEPRKIFSRPAAALARPVGIGERKKKRW